MVDVAKIDHGRVLSCSSCLRDFSVSFTSDHRTGESMIFLSFPDEPVVGNASVLPEAPDETAVAPPPDETDPADDRKFGADETEETSDDLSASTTVGPAA